MTTRRTVQGIAEDSVKGLTDVFISQVTAAVVSAFGLVIIARSLGPSLFGDIAVVMILPSLAVILTDWAVSHAITRYVALFRTNDQTERIWSVVKAGVIFEISIGLLMTIVSAVLAQYFAVMSLGRATLTPLIAIASLTILGQTMLVAAKSILIGMDKTKRFGLIIVSSSFLQGILPAIFVLYGFGVPGAILGMTFGAILLGVFSLLTLGGVIQRNGNDSKGTKTLSAELKLLLSYSLPVFVAVIAGSALPQIFYVIGANYLTPWELGNYSAAMRLGGLMTFVSLPILTVIFPAFSKIRSDERSEDLKSLYIQGTKYTAFIVVPLTGLVISIANPVVQILYGPEYSATPLYLIIYLTTYFYSVIGSMTVGGFLRGQGQTMAYLGLGIVLLCSGSILGIILTPSYGAVGLIISNILSTLFAISFAVIWVSNHYGFKPSSIAAVKTLFSVVLSILFSVMSIMALNDYSMFIQTLVGTVVFGATYFLISVVIQLIDYEDFTNLKNLFEGLGTLGVPIIVILKIYRKFALRESSK